MSESNEAPNAGPTECTTTGSFSDHGIADGVELVTRTHYRLLAADRRLFEPTDRFFDQLESAFIWAYLGSVDEAGIPQHVERAIADARAHTEAEFDDSPDADLRTEVIPAFYRRVAGFHCVYR